MAATTKEKRMENRKNQQKNPGSKFGNTAYTSRTQKFSEMKNLLLFNLFMFM